MKRKKQTRKYTYISLFLLLGFVFDIASMCISVHGQDIGSIESQINSVTGQIVSTQSDITSLQNQANDLLEQKNSLRSNLSSVQSLLSQAATKQQQISQLITSLQTLLQTVQVNLSILEQRKDSLYEGLYEDSQVSPVVAFIASKNAQNFLEIMAFSESSLADQKNQIEALNTQISQLQKSLNQAENAKTLQTKQIQQYQSEQAQLQQQLNSIQSSYNSVNTRSITDQNTLSSLQSELGTLTQQEQQVIQNKVDQADNQLGGSSGGSSNSSNYPPNPGTYGIKINGAFISNFNGPIVLVPNSVNNYAQVSGNSASTAYYTGNIEFRNTNGAYPFVNFINQTSIENYVEGLGEMPSNWSMEALKAQAVAGRTYAENRLGENASYGFDVTDSTYDQAYSGYQKAVEDANGNINLSSPQNGTMYQAGQATKGTILKYTVNGSQQTISALYSANNGGYERGAYEVPGFGCSAQNCPYLPSQTDNNGSDQFDYSANSYCQNIFSTPAYGTDNGNISISGGIGSLYDMAGAVDVNKVSDKSTDYSSDIQSKIGNFNYATFSYSNNGVGNSSNSLDNLRSSTMSNNGNADATIKLTLYGQPVNNTTPSISIDGGQFYTSFDFRSPSNDFLTNKLWYFVNNGSHVTFYNAGFGHTIGMSQCGALGRAQAGQSYTTILNFYYHSPIYGNISTDDSGCLQVSSYSNNGACIRVGITGLNVTKTDNTVDEYSSYSIYAGGVKIYTGNNTNGSDKIEITQN